MHDTFKTRLIAARGKAGLSRWALARRAGLKVDTVRRLEEGEPPPDPYLSTVYQLAAALGVPPRDLIPEINPLVPLTGLVQ